MRTTPDSVLEHPLFPAPSFVLNSWLREGIRTRRCYDDDSFYDDRIPITQGRR